MPFSLDMRDNRFFLRTEAGEPYFCLGLNHMDDSLVEPEIADRHLKQWHFNSIGYSGNDALKQRWPYFARVSDGRHNQFRKVDTFSYCDVFSPAFEKEIDFTVRDICEHLVKEPLVIGVLWSDLPQWGIA